MKRGAVPEHRRHYFTDPAYNLGGRGSSNQQIFEGNGCRGTDILRHPHFLPYLRYLILGADLPDAVRDAFKVEVESCGMVTSSDVVPLGKKAKALTRRYRLNPSAAYIAKELLFDIGRAAVSRTMSTALYRRGVHS